MKSILCDIQILHLISDDLLKFSQPSIDLDNLVQSLNSNNILDVINDLIQASMFANREHVQILINRYATIFDKIMDQLFDEKRDVTGVHIKLLLLFSQVVTEYSNMTHNIQVQRLVRTIIFTPSINDIISENLQCQYLQLINCYLHIFNIDDMYSFIDEIQLLFSPQTESTILIFSEKLVQVLIDCGNSRDALTVIIFLLRQHSRGAQQCALKILEQILYICDKDERNILYSQFLEYLQRNGFRQCAIHIVEKFFEFTQEIEIEPMMRILTEQIEGKIFFDDSIEEIQSKLFEFFERESSMTPRSPEYFDSQEIQ